ncbi:MAG TPA: bifunctional ornithine acetyltransferase/N-acetylglutamate synthase, partial [Actinomycetota bacterium]|nr:bifunctional ornithine acetyltransferase/N-acetylglutamate synthase [Actinomycetota bacterium]
GGDPNWGRILQAAGTAGVAFDPAAVRLEIGGGPGREGPGVAGAAEGGGPGPELPVALVRHGAPTGADASAAMAGPDVRIRLHLGGPGPWACVRTTDLTPEYVRLNSEYTT